jgi:hypothetical protein
VLLWEDTQVSLVKVCLHATIKPSALMTVSCSHCHKPSARDWQEPAFTVPFYVNADILVTPGHTACCFSVHACMVRLPGGLSLIFLGRSGNATGLYNSPIWNGISRIQKFERLLQVDKVNPIEESRFLLQVLAMQPGPGCNVLVFSCKWLANEEKKVHCHPNRKFLIYKPCHRDSLVDS